MMRGAIRLGVRGRLTALITATLALASVVLVAVLYLIVRHLVTSNFGVVQSVHGGGTFVGAGPLVVLSRGDSEIPPEVQEIIDSRIADQVDTVFRQLLSWSVAILIACILIGAVAAWLMSRHTLTRLTDMAATAQAITETDLHRRLALPGADDEIKVLGDTIDSMLERLEEAFERQDRFVAGASHELRTPLTRAHAALEIPLLQGRVPSDLEPDIREALDATRQSEDLIAALLTIARTRRGAPAPAAPCDLGEVVAASARRYSQQATENRQRLAIVTEGQAPAAIDETVAALALGNLLDNAIKYGTASSPITVTTGADDTACWVEVASDGPDLTSVEITQLIEPFQRGEHTRLSGDGLGLGLSIVDGAARSVGGALTLTARPAPNFGLVARIGVPRIKVP
ncbi:MAG: HAMP domain-containing histidine kinase [Promicromonosporaceae bacterium]|nr:HAMP domain-containing histidine kinase [Promicromonosporaceae bacterium]